MSGVWTHLYRAVDSESDTIDFMLSPKRDLKAAKLSNTMPFRSIYSRWGASAGG